MEILITIIFSDKGSIYVMRIFFFEAGITVVNILPKEEVLKTNTINPA